MTKEEMPERNIQDLENVLKTVKEVEEENNVRVIYLTKSGSQLHGTSTPNSDTDYFGIFVPNATDVILHQDADHFKFETSEERNTNSDVDLELHSIYKFLYNVSKGETGAMDLLFSMFREDTQIIFTDEAQMIKNFQKSLVSKRVNKFVGYCIAQSKKYGIKGSRYSELERFNDKIKFLRGGKVKDHWEYITETIKLEEFQYISVVDKVEPMGTNTYVNVLGKLYQDTLDCAEFKLKIKSNLGQYGDRTKASVEGTDWKALSHALRVITEAESLLTNKFIKFPLHNADYLREVKLENVKLDEVLDLIDRKIDEVNALFETSDLPDEIGSEVSKHLIMRLVLK